jgi:hypothetical protein
MRERVLQWPTGLELAAAPAGAADLHCGEAGARVLNCTLRVVNLDRAQGTGEGGDGQRACSGGVVGAA